MVVPWLWACMEADHHGGVVWGHKAAYLTMGEKQREEQGDTGPRVRYTVQKNTTNDPLPPAKL